MYVRNNRIFDVLTKSDSVSGFGKERLYSLWLANGAFIPVQIRGKMYIFT
jgi:hypothetical protein